MLQVVEVETTVKVQLEKMETDLEAARKAEVALRLDMETQEGVWQAKLQEAERRETDLRERLRDGEERQKARMKEEQEDREGEWIRRVEEALQRGAQDERESSRVEIEEYREQVRQHAHTIVALEERVNAAERRERELQEERETLSEHLTDALGRLQDGQPTALPEQPKEVQQLEQTVASLRSSLGASQQEVVSQGEVITSLSRDLAQAHAVLSDLTGELSEQQKLELETHRALVVDQRMQLSMLTQKLTTATQLVQQKDEELKILSGKLTQTERERRELNESQAQGYTHLRSLLTTPPTKDVAVMVSPSDLIVHRSKCKGRRREEMIRQQKETLSEMKQRIRAVEQKWPSKLLAHQREPARQNEKLQNAAMQKRSICSVGGFAFPEALRETAVERMARLDMSDTLELSENTYMDLARALCEALELNEGQLSGCVPLKHLPPGERERLASLRQEDLEVFRIRLALQNSQNRDKDLLLQEQQREIQTLRESRDEGQQLQAKLQTELDTLKQDSDELRQALQDARAELRRDQERHGDRKTLNKERTEERSKQVGHHNCVPNESSYKAALLKRPRRKREEETGVVRRQRAISTHQPAAPVAEH
ncbi:forkhead-associated domain-containing protein 1 [Brachyhypopomus gauderio]|uniref:forkhead-associated domain-containing protein 1 n=1 Tax=Brachyhypopomus gauderio TaxID=698409 RepID=UPI004041D7F1